MNAPDKMDTIITSLMRGPTHRETQPGLRAATEPAQQPRTAANTASDLIMSGRREEKT